MTGLQIYHKDGSINGFERFYDYKFICKIVTKFRVNQSPN